MNIPFCYGENCQTHDKMKWSPQNCFNLLDIKLVFQAAQRALVSCVLEYTLFAIAV